MISGFNTDITCEGITYHVQTEDKGLETPLILSLIYDGGTILASKRSPYNDLLDNFDETVLSERLQRQHKLMCAAVKAGRIEDLKRMTMKESAASKKTAEQSAAPPLELEPVETNSPEPNKTGFETFIVSREFPENRFSASDENNSAEGDFTTKIDFAAKIERSNPFDQLNPAPPDILSENPPMEIPVEIPALLAFREKTVLIDRSEEVFAQVSDPFVRETGRIPKPNDGLIFEVPKIVDEPVIEEVQIFEEEMILPAEAVIILSETINQQANAVDSRLKITLLNETNFRGGDRKTLNISVHQGNEDLGFAKAHVIIKVLGSSFRPIIFHAKTDSNGIAVVHLQLPNFKTGRAVLLIRALHEGEETEIRRVIEQG